MKELDRLCGIQKWVPKLVCTHLICAFIFSGLSLRSWKFPTPSSAPPRHPFLDQFSELTSYPYEFMRETKVVGVNCYIGVTNIYLFIYLSSLCSQFT